MIARTAVILDGAKVAAEIRAEASAEVRRLGRAGYRPGLAVVLAGNHSPSEIYVRGKINASEQVGIYSQKIALTSGITTDELLHQIRVLNRRDDLDGVLVQLPLPRQIDARRVLLEISPEKDVDGLHPLNIGRLCTQRPGPAPCTPAGIMELLRRNQIPVEGRRAVVVGRSDIVGKPMAMLLLNANATVTICHSRTPDLGAVCREADLLVCAVGRAGLISRDFVKAGAVIVDVGINRLTSQEELEKFFPDDQARARSFREKGYFLMGDVDPRVAAIAGAITPVPGGVGPLTVAMLMMNTVQACRTRRGLAA